MSVGLQVTRLWNSSSFSWNPSTDSLMTSLAWTAPALADPSSDDGAEIAAAIRAGNQAAFSQLYRKFQPPLYRFALAMSGSTATAEEAVQETFLRLIRNPEAYQPGKGTLRSYLFGVARFAVYHLRRENKEIQTEDEDTMAMLADPGEPAVDSIARLQRVALVQEAIVALPPHYREVVVLCDLEELSYEDAAQLLGCPIGTVRSRLNRARQQLKARLLGRAGESL